MRIEKSFVTVAEGQLHLRSLTGGEGVPLVALQILPLAGQLLEPAMPFLAEGRTIVVIDLMGYGRSDSRSREWLVEDFVASLIEALDALAIPRFDLLAGHFSALAAAELALRAPQRVRRLILDGAPLTTPEMRERIVTSGQFGLVAAPSTDGAHLAGQWQAMVGMLCRLNPGLEGCDPIVFEPYFEDWRRATSAPTVARAMGSYDLAATLQRLRQPTLVLAAGQDSQRPHFEAVCGLLQTASGHLFEGVHPLHDILAPARAVDYAVAVNRFLSS